MISEIAKALQTTEANAMNRAARLRILPVCGRCGGGGRYSFNGSHSICYGCGGSGQRAPRKGELAAVLEAARECQSDGRLATYLRYLEARKEAKNASQRVLNAWAATGIGDAYNWRNSYANSPTFNQRDADISAINAKMCAAYEEVRIKAQTLCPSKETYQADVIDLAETVRSALATIANAERELHDYLAAH